MRPSKRELSLSLSSFLNHELMTGMDTKRTSDEWFHPRAVAQWGRPTENEASEKQSNDEQKINNRGGCPRSGDGTFWFDNGGDRSTTYCTNYDIDR